MSSYDSLLAVTNLKICPRLQKQINTSFDSFQRPNWKIETSFVPRKTKPKNELNVTANSPSWIHELNTHGYAVVPNVLSHQECDHIIDQAWEWLSQLGTGIDRKDPKTWTNDQWPSNFNGIIQRYRIGHAPFVWKARTSSNVIGVFKEIWGTRELLTSFDAMCILRPAEMVENLENTQSWFHTDQSPKKEGFHCVQGVLNLEEVCKILLQKIVIFSSPYFNTQDGSVLSFSHFGSTHI